MDNKMDQEEASRKLIIIKRLVLTHNGEAIVKNFKEMQFREPDIHKKPNVKCLKDMKLDPEMNTIVLIESGSLLLRNCLFTLRSLPKDLTRKVPCVVALPKTHLSIINSEFVGDAANLTVGLVSIHAASVVISMCRFCKFKGGAIYSVCDEGKPGQRGNSGSEFLI
jgi:hypothetical protein